MFLMKHCPSGERCIKPGTARAWYFSTEELNTCARIYITMKRIFTKNQIKEIMNGNLVWHEECKYVVSVG